MPYVVSVLLIIGSFFKKKSNLYTVIFVGFLCIIIGLNNHHLGNSQYYNMDFENYYTLYLSNNNVISMRNVEIGFKYLMLLFNFMGLSFNTFRLFVAILGYFLIIASIKRYTKYTNLVLVLYIIFPFINDAIQIRNFLSTAIVIYCIKYIVENKKFNNLKYIIGVLLASTIHISAMFYLLFLLFKKSNRKKMFAIILYLTIVLTILAYTEIFPFLAQKLTDNAKLIDYFDRRTTFGMVVVLLIYSMFFITFYVMYKKCKTYIEDKENQMLGLKLKKKFLDTILMINIVLMSILPLLVYDLNFIRLYRNVLPLNYIVFVHAILIGKKEGKKVFLFYLAMGIIFALGLFVYFYALNADTQIWPVFNDNMIF